MAQNFTEASGQGSILYNTGNQKAGTEVVLKDADGKVLLGYTSKKAFSSVVISCPGLIQGGTYTLSVGGSDTEITLDSPIYGNGGMGGFGGHGGMGGFGGGRGGRGTDSQNSGEDGRQSGSIPWRPEGTQPVTGDKPELPEGMQPGTGDVPELPEGMQPGAGNVPGNPSGDRSDMGGIRGGQSL